MTVRIRLPLHILAEQLQNVMVNRRYNPHCPELKKDQWQIWRQMVKEYRWLIEDFQNNAK